MQVTGAGLITFPDGSHGRPRQEGAAFGTNPQLVLLSCCFAEFLTAVLYTGTFQERKLVSGGKQSGAVSQAQDAARTAAQKASEAMGLQG